VEGFDINDQLAAAVAENQHADAAVARLESLGQAAPEARLVGDGDTSLDIARLGHGNNSALLEVQDAVLLEDGAEHGLDDDAGGRVGHEGGLLVQLLGEQVNTQVAVLARGRRGRDADDLARTALQDQDVAHTDVVTGDSDSVGDTARRLGVGAGTVSLPDLPDLNAVMVVMVVVEYLVRHLVQTVTERMVVACWDGTR
jgi:hypothetical protein